MKKLSYILAALGLSCSLASCEDFLTVDPVDSTSKELYYVSADAVRANTATLYGSTTWFDYTCRFMYMGGDMLAGDLYYTYADEGQFYLNTVTQNNQYSRDGWNSLFRLISFANSIMLDMPEMASANGVSKSVIDNAVGECYLFRALGYYLLTEYWHEVPIVMNPEALVTSGNPEDIYLKKNTRLSLYRFICEDLEKAIELLPESDPQPGRVTKWSAKGLLAKVYLTRACYEKGSGQSYDNEDYFALAQQTAEDVINHAPHKLVNDYGSMFEAGTGDYHSESLISIICTTGGYGCGNSRSTEWGRRDALTGINCWGAGKGPTLSLRSLYEDNPLLAGAEDGRRKAVYMIQGDVYPTLGIGNELYPNGYVYRYFLEPVDGVYDLTTEAPMEMLAHLKKYVINADGGNIGSSQDASNDLHLLRLSDLYFVWAEASLKGDLSATLSGQAVTYINDVLSAHGANYQVSDGDLNYVGLLKERRKEFALEGINWFDIQRLASLSEQAAVDYLNSMYRDMVWIPNWTRIGEEFGESITDEQTYTCRSDNSYYVRTWNTRVEEVYEDVLGEGTLAEGAVPDTSNRAAAIVMNASNLVIAVPSDALTKAPCLLEAAVDYYGAASEETPEAPEQDNGEVQE